MGRAYSKHQVPSWYRADQSNAELVFGICASCGEEFDRSQDLGNPFCEDCLEWSEEDGGYDEYVDDDHAFD